jgi:mRNA interferase MazF
MTAPLRGEVWLADLDPTRGHEQAGRRPVLVVSVDPFNEGPADLCIVVPLTSRLRPIPSWVRIDPPDGGVRVPSAALCEAVRSVARSRLVERWGRVGGGTMAGVEDALRILLGIA